MEDQKQAGGVSSDTKYRTLLVTKLIIIIVSLYELHKLEHNKKDIIQNKCMTTINIKFKE